MNETFSYLDSNHAVRFIKRREAIPNMEVKFARKNFDRQTMKDSIKVVVGEDVIIVPSIEEQIAFKRTVLGSDKDIEDAKHLEEVFKDHIDKKKLERLETSIRSGEYEF